MLSSGSN